MLGITAAASIRRLLQVRGGKGLRQPGGSIPLVLRSAHLGAGMLSAALLRARFALLCSSLALPDGGGAAALWSQHCASISGDRSVGF